MFVNFHSFFFFFCIQFLHLIFFIACIVPSIHDKGSGESSLLEDLIHIVLHGKNEEPGISVVSDTLAVLIGIA